MLEEMRIAGLGVIDDALLEFAPGFTALTGETGAGKTMVLSGLALLCGARADPGLLRSSSDRAVVEGRVRVDPEGPVARRATEAGGDLDDDVLIIARTIEAAGRSRAYLGGRGVPASLLAGLAEDLVAVHGQSEQQRLLRPSLQRGLLDRFAGAAVDRPMARYEAAHRRLGHVVGALDTLAGQARERAREADLLRFGLGEVEQVSPQPGEDHALAAEVARLAHADGLRRAAETGRRLLSSDEVGAEDALAAIAGARQALEAEHGHDPALDDLATRLAEVSYLLADVAADLASYAQGVDVDPARLEVAQERQAALGGLLRKYGEDIAAVLTWAEHAQARLAELDHDDDQRAALEREREELLAVLSEAAAEVSSARTAAAGTFATAVGDELAALAMPHAAVELAVTQRDDPAGLPVNGRMLGYGPTGVDDVELLLRPHAGAPPRPLARSASGGELSRVMLAIEVVFAGSDPVPTFVFDEVDAGVGGRAAVEVGRRLARLARTSQVVVVTHLPQVAAFADRHLVVTKQSDGRVTRSGVRTVEGEERLRELSRMLGGLEHSTHGRGHAEELLATAASAKSGPRVRRGGRSKAGLAD